MFNAPLSQEEALWIQKAAMAERFGWTLDYINSMDETEFCQFQEVTRAIDAARKQVGGKK